MRCFRSGGERCEECVDKVRCEIYSAVSDLKLQIEMLKIDIGNLKKEPEKPKVQQEKTEFTKESVANTLPSAKRIIINQREPVLPNVDQGWTKPDVQEADTA
jgi:hypothetical protein